MAVSILKLPKELLLEVASNAGVQNLKCRGMWPL
jgi:hypothetical protein